MPKTCVVGDIHGAYKALQQCLHRSHFNYERDHLICLGDIGDGWPDTRLCLDELLKIRNLTYVLGNHDIWLINWMKSGNVENSWLTQGGAATISSYGEHIPPSHIAFWDNALPYFKLDHKLFVHAGIDPKIPLDHQDLRTLLWDRSFVQKAWELFIRNENLRLTMFEEVYLGHTPIPFERPIQSCEIWMMDTGAGWSGVLSLMDVNTKETFVSDKVPTLYPGVEGRTKKK